MTKPQTRLVDSPSGLSSLTQYCLPGGASRLAALLLPQILAVFSVVAPCHPGAALRNPVLLQRGQATRSERPRFFSHPCGKFRTAESALASIGTNPQGVRMTRGGGARPALCGSS